MPAHRVALSQTRPLVSHPCGATLQMQQELYYRPYCVMRSQERVFGGGIWLKKGKISKKLLPLDRSAIIMTALVKQVNGYHRYRYR